MDSAAISTNKPHAVCIPFPFQGHVTPMIKLAVVLHRKGFRITFINTEFIHDRLFKSGAGALSYLSTLPDFHFLTFPDGLPPPAAPDTTTRDPFSLCQASRNNFFDPLRNLIVSGLGGEVSCVVADCQMPFAVTIADEVGAPCMLFWPVHIGAFMGLLYHRQLKERGLVPAKDEDLDRIIDWIPGLKDVRLRDLPFVDVYKFDFPMKEIEANSKASGIIYNTFEALDQHILNAISSIFPNLNVYAIGPLNILLNDNSNSNNIASNLLEEDPQCLQWLDTMKPNSVTYISFGSTTIMKSQQLIEFAWGILNSNHPFLWVIRPNMVEDAPTPLLPPEFLEKAKDKGYITTWCPQEKVLNHPSVGGFLTHCGYNSTLESICAGIPMICWPWFGDQQIICRYCCTNWGIGLEISGDVRREEVEKLVRELMEGGEKGKELKKKAIEWKKLALEATGEGGSSSLDLEKLVKGAGAADAR